MDKDAYWELFRDTGDPTAWLLYRAGAEARNAAPPEDRGEGDGRQPPAPTG